MTRLRLLGPLTLLTVCSAGFQACSILPRPVVSHDPLSPHEHVSLGQAYEAQGLKGRAAQEFQGALRQDSHYVPALIAVGNLSFESGALGEAEQRYREALEVAPHHPGASNNLAMVYLSRGERLDEAERLATDALEQGGVLRPYAFDTLATLYLRQGRYKEAEAVLDRAQTSISPDKTILHERLAQLRRELNTASPPRQ
jgi:tetratricopeptide (TPR) repeat protein